MIIKDLGIADYETVAQAMRDFTLNRDADTEDELWLLEHHPVFTQGTNGDAAHLLNTHDIPVVQSDRGGQVTYHGPGQLIAYPLIDLRRLNIGVRQMVTMLENTVIHCLSELGIASEARSDAPGVYVDNRKIASLGLRVKRGGCYHGISFNIDMDLTPFTYINPCGYADMDMIDLKSIGVSKSIEQVKQQFIVAFETQLKVGYTSE